MIDWELIDKNNKEKERLFNIAIVDFESVEKEYLEKFGRDSLEYVDLWDPLGIIYHPEDVINATKRLKTAIRTGKPLENLPPDTEVIY